MKKRFTAPESSLPAWIFVQARLTLDLKYCKSSDVPFAGIKKEYKLVKNVKGIGDDHDTPIQSRSQEFVCVLNVRFGFEFPIKRKIKS